MTEPEEIVEAHLSAALAEAVPSLEVVGALAPAPDGIDKTTPDSCVVVAVDLASQDIDWSEPSAPCTYSASVSVNVARGDDKTGSVFRDACRAVRAVLVSLSGDGCSGLDGDGFRCDSFVMGGTSTSPDLSDEVGGMSKTYSATATGRFFQPTD